jgi:hypothetical protein
MALLAAPAGAQQSAAAVVAGPLPDGSTLAAFDRGGRLCLRASGPSIGTAPDCLEALPDTARHARFDSVSRTGSGGGQVWFAAVTPDVATAEMRFGNGETVSAPAGAGPAYRGRFAGRVRFVLFATRTGDEPYLIRLLGADGRVVSAIGNLLAGGPQIAPPTTFASGRTGGARWSAQAFVEQQLRGTPLEPDRLERATCVGFAPSARNPLSGATIMRAQTCADEGPLHGAVVPGVDTACRPDGTAIVGFVAPRVARLVAVLGDGRRVPIAERALPAGGPARRGFAFVAGRDTAVRRIEAFDAGGRRVASIVLRLAPGSLDCGSSALIDVFRLFRRGPLGSELTPPPGPPRLLAADEGVRLCFSIGRFAPHGADCALPPIEAFESRVLRQTTPAGTFVAGVLPAEVARVRIRLSGGAAIVLPTTPTLPGYTGRYAGAVRFFALPLARPRRAVGVDLLGASGRRLGDLAGPDFTFPPAATVLRAGGVRIGATVISGVPCVAVGASQCGPVFGGMLVTATCAPRRIVVTTLLDARATALEISLSDRRTVRARIVRLAAAAGIPRRLAVVVLPAGAAPVSATVRRGRGARPARRPFVLPPAARQCGYAGTAALPGSFGLGAPEFG